eukprot:SAG25_NODE_271_length_10616_cov_28.967091_5_plen_84_part_00
MAVWHVWISLKQVLSRLLRAALHDDDILPALWTVRGAWTACPHYIFTRGKAFTLVMPRRMPTTYESVMTKGFLHGRTEVGRSG